MKKFLITGVGLLALLAAMVGCTGASVAGPAIDSITATIVTAGTTTATTTPTTMTTTATTTTTTMTTATTTTTTSPTTSPSAQVINVQVSITVSNFQVVSSIGSTVGDGYFVYYLDRVPAPLSQFGSTTPTTTTTLTPPPSPTTTAPGLTTSTTTPGQPPSMVYATTDTSFTWTNLSPGVHVFSVQLVDTNGNPLNPPVVAGAAITIPAQ